MKHYFEGCTATVLLVWADGHENFYVQCANVGDSACVMNIDGKQIKMLEDHRISSYSKRLHMQETGEPLKDGDTRLCGLNLGRMLEDKFLKQQEAHFSTEPYISEVVHIHQASKGFGFLASDGFWDVNFKKAIRLLKQARERYTADTESLAEKIGNFLLNEARTQRTKGVFGSWKKKIKFKVLCLEVEIGRGNQLLKFLTVRFEFFLVFKVGDNLFRLKFIRSMVVEA